MRLLLLPLITVLGACASPQLKADWSHTYSTPAYRDCEYQAKVATPGTNNVLEDMLRMKELTSMCMTNKGFASR